MPSKPLPALVPGHDRPPAIISPSVLSADFARLAEECKKVTDLGADWLHLDVMDGHFVPNLTIGAPVVKSVRKHTDSYLDCHLMVSDPKTWIQDYAKAGADMYTFHIESVQPDLTKLSSTEVDPQVAEVCKLVRAAGMHCGLAVKPATPAELLIPYVEAGLLDMVLVMTVEPGFGGQKFMSQAAAKCRVLRQRYPNLHIQVDGGLTAETVKEAAACGANSIVAGTAVFDAASPGEVIRALRTAVDTAAV